MSKLGAAPHTLFLTTLLLLISFRVLAQPDIVGTFSESGIPTYRDAIIGGGCPIISPVMATGTTSFTLNITSQSGTSIDGTVSIVSPSGASLSSSVSGTIDAMGIVQLSGMSSSLNEVFIDGSFDGSTLVISVMDFQYAPSASNTCHANAALVSVSKTTTGAINPEEAPGTELEDASKVQSDVLTIETPVHGRVRRLQVENQKGGSDRQGGPKVSRFNETGFDFEASGGLNAGDHQYGNLGVWLSYNYTDTENDFSRTAFDSDRHTVIGGIDLSPDDRFVYGLAFAYEDSDTDTVFNAGELESDGFTLAPYIGVLLTDFLSLDASFGYSWINNDQFRTDPTTAAIITSDPDSDRFFFSGNLNTITFVDNWIISGRLGVLFAKSEIDDFVESDGTAVAERETKLGELRFGGDVAYSFQEYEPFISLLYEYDFEFEDVNLTTGPQPANDNNDVFFTAGLRYFGNQGLSANVEYSKRLFREDFDEDSFSVNVRYDF